MRHLRGSARAGIVFGELSLTLYSLVLVVGALAGAVSAIAGFGVGSLLTPLLLSTVNARAAVAAVAIPHAIGTALRLWRLRTEVAFDVLRGFGMASALGGLAGAVIFTRVRSALLAAILGALLAVVGTIQLGGWATRFRMPGPWAWLAGAASGFFGGLVGNQGGLRSAGLLTFGLTPRQFVATAAAIALMVDCVRVPVYVLTEREALARMWIVMMVATVGVVAGTFAGTGLLLRLSERTLARAIGIVLIVLGASLLVS